MLKQSYSMLDVYGVTLPDYVIQAATSKEMERLIEVDMNCGMRYTSIPFFQNMQPFSRFQHSLGVAALTYKFTNDPKQTLASLFHDIATPAFSHVVDFVNGDYLTQESTEEATYDIIANSTVIQEVLKSLNLTSEDVADYHKFPICDNDSPRLSCDRLEYSLANMVNYGFATKQEAKSYLENLVVSNNEEGEIELCFKDQKLAEEFTHHVIECSRIYAGDWDRYGMEYLALVIKEGLKKQAITMDDLMVHDAHVIKCFVNGPCKCCYERFTSLYDAYKVDTTQGNDILVVDAKKRYINPLVVNQGRIYDISALTKEEIDAFVNQDFNYGVKGEFHYE